MVGSNNTALYAFRKYGDNVLRCAFACTGSYQEAEDITQEVFLALHLSPQKFTCDEHMKAWLLKAALNKCRNFRKSFRFTKTQYIDERLEKLLVCKFGPEERKLQEDLAALPEKYSSVLYLYYYEDCTIREIARLLEKNENTVSSLLQRGRQKLRIELEKEGYHG